MSQLIVTFTVELPDELDTVRERVETGVDNLLNQINEATEGVVSVEYAVVEENGELGGDEEGGLVE